MLRSLLPRLGLALLSLVLAVALTELVFACLLRLRAAPPASEVKLSGDPARELRWIPARDKEFREELLPRGGGAPLEFVYRIDGWNRRITPEPPGSKREHVLLFGDSFTFGEAVAEGETTEARLAQLLPGAHVYNYGYRGYGPNHVLWRLEHRPLAPEVAEKRGIALYIYTDDQTRRVSGTKDFLRWGAGAPAYEDGADGVPHFVGSFAEAYPWRTRLYALLAHSSLLDYFHIDVPLRYGPADFRAVAKRLARIRDLYLQSFPGQSFVVVLYPGGGILSRHVIKFLVEEKIPVVDLSGSPIYDLDHGVGAGPDGFHPTAAVHEAFAKLLAEELRKRGY